MFPSQISIYLGGATCPTAVGVEFAHVENIAETEKAVQVRADDGATCWLPKKALLADKSTLDHLPAHLREHYEAHPSYKLARWFKPDGYTCRFLERAATVAVLTCR